MLRMGLRLVGVGELPFRAIQDCLIHMDRPEWPLVKASIIAAAVFPETVAMGGLCVTQILWPPGQGLPGEEHLKALLVYAIARHE